jgi:hypothetical protein
VMIGTNERARVRDKMERERESVCVCVGIYKVHDMFMKRMVNPRPARWGRNGVSMQEIKYRQEEKGQLVCRKRCARPTVSIKGRWGMKTKGRQMRRTHGLHRAL